MMVVKNSVFDLMLYFDVSYDEFMNFWMDLYDEERNYYRTVKLS